MVLKLMKKCCSKLKKNEQEEDRIQKNQNSLKKKIFKLIMILINHYKKIYLPLKNEIIHI